MFEGIKLLELLVNYKIMNSKGEVRRAIKNNAIKLNDALIQDENKSIGISDLKKKIKLKFLLVKNILFLKLIRFFKAF